MEGGGGASWATWRMGGCVAVDTRRDKATNKPFGTRCVPVPLKVTDQSTASKERRTSACSACLRPRGDKEMHNGHSERLRSGCFTSHRMQIAFISHSQAKCGQYSQCRRASEPGDLEGRGRSLALPMAFSRTTTTRHLHLVELLLALFQTSASKRVRIVAIFVQARGTGARLGI